MTIAPGGGQRLKLLLCCEFYHPSRGGVQEVMRQLAERFAAAGHDVTVATTALPERTFSELNGVRIAGFHVSGNHVRGLEGEIARYQAFLRDFDGDAVLIKAAQQWTFDASWPALDAMRCRKVFIPCGFSSLYEPSYASYFEELPAVLARFDSLIFYAEDYRDINFAREHGLARLHILPNGASEKEFGTAPAPGIRARLGIPEEARLLITVGTPVTNKGHLEVAEAFERLDAGDRPLALVLNGQWGARPADMPEPPKDKPETAAEGPQTVCGAAAPGASPPSRQRPGGLARILQRAVSTFRHGGAGAFLRRAMLWLCYRTLWLVMIPLRPVVWLGRKALRAARLGVYRARLLVHDLLTPKAPPPPPPPPPPRSIDEAVADIRRDPRKTVVQSELPRPEVVELFFAADLFVFASKVEYSPLVLFEACAAGLPFVSVPAGNAAEIARWTGGGVICPAEKDGLGYVKVDPAVLAGEIEKLLGDDAARAALGEAGRRAWAERYSWDVISRRYLAILAGADQARDPAGQS